MADRVRLRHRQRSGSNSHGGGGGATSYVRVRFLSGSALGVQFCQVKTNMVIEGFAKGGPGCGPGLLDVGYILKKINGEKVQPLAVDENQTDFKGILQKLDTCLGSDGETTLEFRKVSKFTSILATGSVAELRLQWTGTKILGIRFSALTVAMGQTRGNYEKSRVAIYVDEVEKGSLADGTVQKGDIIVSVNGVMVVNKSMAIVTKQIEDATRKARGTTTNGSGSDHSTRGSAPAERRASLVIAFKRGVLEQLAALNDNRMRGDRRRHCSLIVIGDSGVGKTRLINVFSKKDVGGESGDGTLATIGVEAVSSNHMTADGRMARVQVWDTAGQERYHAITRAHFRRGQGALLVFDLTSYSSFRSIDTWLREYRQIGEKKPVVLVGNKRDLSENRAVTTLEAAKYAAAQDPPLHYVETSALQPPSVGPAFERVVEDVLRMSDDQRQRGDSVAIGTSLISVSSSSGEIGAVDLRERQGKSKRFKGCGCS